MTEVIPAIIAENFNELKKKIKLVQPYVRWVQLDIMDGKFVPNIIWNNPEDLLLTSPSPPMVIGGEGPSLEAHLMIQEPEKHVESWINAGVKRIIFHIEAVKVPGDVVKICREKGVEVGIAINPETSVEELTGRIPVNSLDMILVMGVTPGAGGQEFNPEVLLKIRALRKSYPNLTMGVDGGMNQKTAKQVVEAGANVIVAGSYIFGSKDIQRAISELRSV